MIPPVGPGRSLMTIEFCPAVCSTKSGETGSPANARGGTSDGDPQRQPTQTGRAGSPCSNSTHTPAPKGGTRYTPIGGPVGPARGTHGSAQLEGATPSTSVTETSNRPRSRGSTLFTTVPLNLP